MLPVTPYSKSNHFGLAISAHAVRAMVVGANSSITSQAEIVVNELLLQGDSVNEKRLVDALTALKTKVAPKNNFAAVCIPEKLAFTRQFTLPAISLDEVDEAISWQLEKIFPFSPEEIYYDWRLLSQSKTELRVLVVAIQKKLLDGLHAALERVGISPISFEPSAATLSKLTAPDQKLKQIVVEIDANGSAATLVIEGVSLLTTTTNTPAVNDPTLVINDIIASINSLLGYLTKNNLDAQNLSIVLTGERASEALAQSFATTLNLPVSLASINNVPPAFHLSYIAAIEEVAPPSNSKTINLLPTTLQMYYRTLADEIMAKATLKLIAIMSVVVCLGAVVVWATSTFMLSNEQRAAKTIVTNPSPSQSNINVPAVMRQAQRVIALFPKKKTPEATLREIIPVFPPEVVLSRINYNPISKVWLFEGTAQSRDGVFVLKDALENSGVCTNIHVPLSSLEGGQNRPFSLSCAEVAKPL